MANIKHGLWLTGRSIKNYVRAGISSADAG
jgi:hypothetical protein